MRYEFWLALRYLFGRSQEKFISLISMISVIGIATGVATLIVVIGVMSGFDRELRERIIGVNSHLVVDRLGGIDEPEDVREQLLALPGVTAAAPYINAPALLSFGGNRISVMVRGVNPEQEECVTSIRKYVKHGELKLGENRLIIGKELAGQMGLKVGDDLELISLQRLGSEVFRISGIFDSGMYDFDSGVIFLSLEDASAFSATPETVSGISVRTTNAFQAEPVKELIAEELGFPYFSRTWMDLNRNLFNALQLEKTVMFLILTLIIIVAAMNMVSTLIMMVMEKTRDIGILKAIGATKRRIAMVFTVVGFYIGVLGTTLGVGGGLLLAYILKKYEFVKLPEDVYYIDRLPVLITVSDVVWIVSAALAISLLATLYPAIQGARLNPVKALRYE